MKEVPDADRFCGVDRLQITCLRRTKNPSAVTAKTPKNGLEIIAAIVDRVTFNTHILETGTQSYRLRTTKTTRRTKNPA